MKKYIVASLLLLSALPVLAIDRPNRDDVRDRVEARREEVKANVVTRRNEKIRKFAQKMVNRLNAAIARLNKLVARITSRLNKVDAAGGNTVAARAKLAEAQTAITAAQTSVNGIMSAVDTALASGTPKENFKEVITLVNTTRDKVKEAHAKLVETITLIKGMSTASSTPEH